MLRFWETKFSQIKPVKRGGGRRYYRPEDILLLRRIRQWLYHDGYTIRGVQQLLESLPLEFAASAETRDVAGLLAAQGANAGAASGSDTASETDTTTTSRLGSSAAPGPDRRAACLDPETRTELEEIRRDLQQTRALLDGLAARSLQKRYNEPPMTALTSPDRNIADTARIDHAQKRSARHSPSLAGQAL